MGFAKAESILSELIAMLLIEVKVDAALHLSQWKGCEYIDGGAVGADFGGGPLKLLKSEGGHGYLWLIILFLFLF
jgi:hypothetical protein